MKTPAEIEAERKAEREKRKAEREKRKAEYLERNKIMHKPARIRIQTMIEGLRAGIRPKGQDTRVTAVLEDGTEIALSVMAAHVSVDSRTAYVTATLVLHDVELDIQSAEMSDDVAWEHASSEFWKAEAKRLSEESGIALIAPLGMKANVVVRPEDGTHGCDTCAPTIAPPAKVLLSGIKDAGGGENEQPEGPGDENLKPV